MRPFPYRATEPLRQRALAPAMVNLGPAGVAQGFSLQDGGLVWTGPRPGLSAERLFAPPEGTTSPLDCAAAFLRQALAGGPQPAREVFDEAAALGLRDHALRRVGGRLGVVISRLHAPGKRGAAGWEWRLPDDLDSDDTPVRGLSSKSESTSPGCGGALPCAAPLPAEPHLSDEEIVSTSSESALSDEEIPPSLRTAEDAPVPDPPFVPEADADADADLDDSAHTGVSSESASSAPPALVCPACVGPLTERGVCWGCNGRPCAVCGAATGAALQRYCSYACQEREA